MEIFDLKGFRKEYNLTQKEIATILGFDQSFVSSIENNTRQFPKDKIPILKSKYGDISAYIRKGEAVIQKNHSGDNINGQTVKVTKDGSDKLVEVIMKQADQLSVSQAQLSKAQEQIDRLITIIEGRQK